MPPRVRFQGFFAGCVATAAGCGVTAIPEDARQAVAEWRDRIEEGDPCRIDAMEHCVGGSAAAAACGPVCAVVLGQLLELRQGDGNAMDLHNNEVGAVRCGRPILPSENATVDGGDAVGCCEILLEEIDGGLEVEGPCN